MKAFSVELQNAIREKIAKAMKTEIFPISIDEARNIEEGILFFSSPLGEVAVNPKRIFVQFGKEKQSYSTYLVKEDCSELDLELLASLISCDVAGLQSEDPTEEIAREYRRSLLEKFADMEGLVNESDKLRQLVHKLAGNAGLYGFDSSSVAFKAFEKDLTDDPANFQGEKALARLQELKKTFCIAPKISPAPQQSAPAKEKKAGSPLDLYIVDDDENIIKFVEIEAKKSALNIQYTSSFQEAIETVKNPDFHPKFLLVDIFSEKENIDGFSVIQTYKLENPSSSSSIIGILSGKGDISNRIRAYELGIDVFFEKPIAIDILCYQIEKYNESIESEKLQVLVVDDDTEFTQFLSTVLEPKGYTIKTLTNAEEFFATLQHFRPDLILLDVFMPNISGLELLSILHSDYRYRKVPVAICSGAKNPDVMKKAYSLGIQDFLIKPIKAETIINVINRILKRYRSLEIIFEKDASTGLFNKQSLQNQFQTYELNYTLAGLIGLSLFYPNRPDDAIASSDQKTFADILLQNFGSREVVGLWKENQFIVLMANFREQQLRLVLDNFFAAIRSDPFFEQIQVAATIAEYPQDGDTIATIANRISFVKEPWQIGNLEEVVEAQGRSRSPKLVQIITSNPSLAKLINFGLQLRNFQTEISPNGQKAIDWLNQHFLKTPPNLIILDGDLDDADAVVVLEMLKALTGERIPIYMLSTFSREEDIAAGMHSGATNYFTKPFGLTILLQSIEQATT